MKEPCEKYEEHKYCDECGWCITCGECTGCSHNIVKEKLNGK